MLLKRKGFCESILIARSKRGGRLIEGGFSYKKTTPSLVSAVNLIPTGIERRAD